MSKKIALEPTDKKCFRAKVLRAEREEEKFKLHLATNWGQPVFVEVAGPEFERLGLSVGAEVYVSAKDLQLFQEDFMI